MENIKDIPVYLVSRSGKNLLHHIISLGSYGKIIVIQYAHGGGINNPQSLEFVVGIVIRQHCHNIGNKFLFHGLDTGGIDIIPAHLFQDTAIDSHTAGSINIAGDIGGTGKIYLVEGFLGIAFARECPVPLIHQKRGGR